jgi:hypothetical protein
MPSQTRYAAPRTPVLQNASEHRRVRPGYRRHRCVPTVIYRNSDNGQTEVMVDTIEHAIDVAGLLIWSGVDELEPDIDLRPP